MDYEWRSSSRPWSDAPSKNNASTTLYDSFELRAINLRLTKALRDGANGPSSSPCLRRLSSPTYYNRCLTRIYKESARSPKKISRSNVPRERKALGNHAREADRGFLAQLWKKVKRGLSKNRRGGCGTSTNNPR